MTPHPIQAVLEILGLGKEPGVEALSDDARNEVYFALRLATIRRFMERSDCMTLS